MSATLSEQQLAEIRSVDLLALMSERSAGQISGYLAALLATVDQRTTLLHAMQKLARNSAAEAKGRRKYGEELEARIAKLEKDARETDRAFDQTIGERDRTHDAADKLAYAVAPVEVIGEHSGDNDPWENALDFITPHDRVERLTAQVAAVRAFATSHEYRWLLELLDGPGTHGGAL